MNIAVIGLGGCGFNSLQNLSHTFDKQTTTLICLTTESVKPSYNENITFIQIGANTTKGLGAGAKPEVGSQAFIESQNVVKQAISEFDVAIVAAGLGGGTGTGGIVKLLQLLTELSIPHLVIVTLPFPFEGKKKKDIANNKIEDILELTTPIMVLENSKILSKLDKATPLTEAFKQGDRALTDMALAITDMIKEVGLINIDIADLNLVLSQPGYCLVGKEIYSQESGINFILNQSLLLTNELNLKTAKSAIIVITAPQTMSLIDYDKIGNDFRNELSDSITIISGVNYRTTNSHEIEVFFLISGM